MSDEKKFEAFKKQAVDANERAYGKEIRKKYGNEEVDAANKAVMGMTQTQYSEWTELGDEIQRRLEEAVSFGIAPDSQEGKDITVLHKHWLTLSGTAYNPTKHRGIAELYVSDSRFTAYYDNHISGCAQFLRDAVQYWAE